MMRMRRVLITEAVDSVIYPSVKVINTEYKPKV